MDIDKGIQELRDRLQYIGDVFGPREIANHKLLGAKLKDFLDQQAWLDATERQTRFVQLAELFDFLENRLEDELTPMDRVRIVRHPQRVCLSDILENVYDNYTEIGGHGEYSIDPAMLIARAYITRRHGDRVVNQSVMVIGHEKGHGEEFRNGGSAKPWGNAKALHYMKVAETENIPVHTWIFTPGSYPIEDYPGAAQQIAKNLYEMAGLKVPIVAVFSEGGSGGAEAIGLADKRIMLSHGYYSVISPEGAAAIQEGLRTGRRASPETIDKCARMQKITAVDNWERGYVDTVVAEPPLGARQHHFDFFRRLRTEIIRATDEVVGDVRGMRHVRSLASGRRSRPGEQYAFEDIVFRWSLSAAAKNRLVLRRDRKYRGLAKAAFQDRRTLVKRVAQRAQDAVWSTHSFFRYDFFGKHKRRLARVMEEVSAEALAVSRRVGRPLKRVVRRLLPQGNGAAHADMARLTSLSCPEEGTCLGDVQWLYTSPRSLEDKAVTCPNAHSHGCADVWAPDLFGEFAGVCPNCGHHFPMECEWYLYNVLGFANAWEFNEEIESGDPLGFEGFSLKLEEAKAATKLKSACLTFETEIEHVRVVAAVLNGGFRGGSVGAAEGEKFIRAAERARKKHYPLVAYVHGTAGIRIQEGVNGVIQMPRVTMAVRNYIEAGGLYLVIYDTNSYAGPVASFLGCSPYQFAIRSANLGFAGPMVIRETTGLDISPKYHSAHQALARGHIHGVWDRREMRRNIHQALLTMGGRNLYYR